MHRFSTLNDTALDTVLRLQAQQQQTWRTLPEEGIDVEFEGETLKGLPNVFPPRGDTKLVADALGTLSGASILDMGTGTGALAIKAARMGANNVTAVDINEQAVRNAELNVERCDLQSQIEVRLSDGFKCVDQHARFDLIVANLPGRSAKAIDAVELHNGIPGSQPISTFIARCGAHLNPDGRILMAKANYPELDQVVSLAETSGLSVVVRATKQPDGSDSRTSYVLEFRSAAP